MKNSIFKVAVPALFTFAFVTASAWAQTPEPSSSSPKAASSTAATASKHQKKHQDAVEKRISDLHAQLKITGQQSQQWDAFAQTMRDNAQRAEQAFQERAKKLPSMSADDAMKSYAALAQMHADNMQKLAAALSTLYGTLSDAQKTTADTLFRDKHTKRHAAPHKHKPAAPAGTPAAPAPTSN